MSPGRPHPEWLLAAMGTWLSTLDPSWWPRQRVMRLVPAVVIPK